MENAIVSPQGHGRILDFENNKVEFLTLEELSLTSPERFYGQQQLNGIEHHKFVSKVLEMVVKMGFKAQMDPIYAAQNKAKLFQGVSILPDLEEIHGKNSIRAHILRRILTRVVISDYEDEISNSAIAISYHQNGIEVAFGPNIKICQNQCILGTGRYLRTYGNEKLPFEKMLEVIEDWMFTFKQKREEDQESLKRLMEYPVDFTTMSKIIGELSLMRVGKDDLGMSVDYPLAQGQINRVSKAYLSQMKDRSDDEKIISLYDVYNYGTAELKPDQMEIPNVLVQNAVFGNYVLNLIKK